MRPHHTSRRRSDEGFTILELSVVIVILGVLLTISVVTLLAVRGRASDAAAKSSVVQGLKTQKTVFADRQAYSADATALAAEESSVTFVPWTTHADVVGLTPAEVKGKVFIREASGAVVTLVSRSSSGTCFWTRELNGRTEYAENDCATDPTVFGASW